MIDYHKIYSLQRRSEIYLLATVVEMGRFSLRYSFVYSNSVYLHG